MKHTAQTYFKWGTRSWGTYPTASLPLLLEGYFLGVLIPWLFQLVVLEKTFRKSAETHQIGKSIVIQMRCQQPLLHWSQLELIVDGESDKLGQGGSGNRDTQGAFGCGPGRKQWRSELGVWGGRSNRWGIERLGKHHQQYLATDLACMRVGGKLTETDSKQCSTN